MTAIGALRAYLAETEDYRRIFDHLRLDQQTVMPDAATADRARQIGLVERQIRLRTADPALGALVGEAESLELDPTTAFDDWAVLRTARRDHDVAVTRPIDLLAEFQIVAAEAFLVWRDARAASDWGVYTPWLKRLVDINRGMADAIGYDDHPLDALLSMYEPALPFRSVDTLLWSLREPVIALNARRLSTFAASPSPLPTIHDTGRLLDFVRDLTGRMGFEWTRGAVAISPHPFTSPSGPNDVRFTLRDDMPLDDVLRATVHEIGHALYEQGIGPGLWGTAAARGIMPYVHESQAKFWENIVGRTPEFCDLAFALMQPHLGEELRGVAPETLHAAGLGGPTTQTRIATDELTFNLHILLRWEIETGLLDGTLAVDAVPELWNSRSVEYFGSRPSSDREGALQDPHWCHRWMGLFSSYVIGNLLSAQLAESMKRDGIDIAADAGRGEFTAILGWLRANVHAVGRSFTLAELVPRATGRQLSADAYLAHLTRRHGASSASSS